MQPSPEHLKRITEQVISMGSNCGFTIIWQKPHKRQSVSVILFVIGRNTIIRIRRERNQKGKNGKYHETNDMQRFHWRCNHHNRYLFSSHMDTESPRRNSGIGLLGVIRRTASFVIATYNKPVSWLIVYSFTSRSSVSHSFGDVSRIDEGLCSSLNILQNLNFSPIYMYIVFHIYLFVCLFRFFVPLENFFTHMETSPFPVKGCNFWPMLGTHGHWAARFFLACHSHCDTGHPFIMPVSEDPWHSYLLTSV